MIEKTRQPAPLAGIQQDLSSMVEIIEVEAQKIRYEIGTFDCTIFEMQVTIFFMIHYLTTFALQVKYHLEDYGEARKNVKENSGYEL